MKKITPEMVESYCNLTKLFAPIDVSQEYTPFKSKPTSQPKKEDGKKGRTFVLFCGGQLCAASIKGPYTTEEANMMVDCDRNSQGDPHAVAVLSIKEAWEELASGKVDNLSELS